MDMIYVEDCCEILDSMRVPITASDREEGEYPYYGANGIQDHVADYIFDDELVLPWLKRKTYCLQSFWEVLGK